MPKKLTTLTWREGNSIQLLHSGGQFFPALCKAIDEAQSTIHLETYIFNLDKTGTKVLDHLREACARGIKVRVVIDGFGSAENALEIGRILEDMGAQCRVYRPEPTGVRRLLFSSQRLRRLHRKVAVIDKRVAFVGGINIIDDLEDVPNDGKGPRPRFDFAVQIRGPLVQDLDRAQSDLWLRMAWRSRENWERIDWPVVYERLRRWRRRASQQGAVQTETFEPGVKATVLLRDNIRFRRTIENVYIQALDHARHDALIANSYFFPGARLRYALKRAAARGVHVRLLLQGRWEYPLQYRACRSLYNQVLADGIEIYEYMPSYLHAKVAVIDGCAMVGSSNMDPFSLLLAREANVFIDDEEFAAELQRALEDELANNCDHITTETREKCPWYDNILDAASYLALRAGVVLTGKASQY